MYTVTQFVDAMDDFITDMGKGYMEISKGKSTGALYGRIFTFARLYGYNNNEIVDRNPNTWGGEWFGEKNVNLMKEVIFPELSTDIMKFFKDLGHNVYIELQKDFKLVIRVQEIVIPRSYPRGDRPWLEASNIVKKAKN